jgi:CubicO group peptidase (beta-lactamase class C family)
MRTLIAASVLVGFAPLAGAWQEVDRSKAREERLRYLAEQALEQQDLSGLAWVALVGTEELAGAALGHSDRGPLTADTALPAASLAELLFAAAALQAAEAKGIQPGTELSALLPERKLELPGVSLHGLLAHTSGLALVPASLPIEAGAPAEEGQPPVDPPWLTWLRSASPAAAPQSCYGWTNADLLLLDLWMQSAAGQGLAAQAEAKLFPALGWKDKRLIGALAGTWMELAQDQGLGRLESVELPAELAGVELELSARELAAGLRALLGGELLDAETSERLTANVHLPNGQRTGRGLGLAHTRLAELDGLLVAGAAQGTNLRAVHYPSLDLTIALLAPARPQSLAALERALTVALFDLPQPERTDLPVSSEELARLVGEYQIGCDSLLLSVQEGRLRLTGADLDQPLAYQGGGRFLAQTGADLTVEFEPGAEGPAQQFVLSIEGQQSIARRFR